MEAAHAIVSFAMANNVAQTPAEPDWTDQVADFIVDQVDRARLKTTGPVVDKAPFAVFGVMAMIIAIFVLPLVLIALTRLASAVLTSVMGNADFLWVYYAVLGVVFMLAGSVAWARRDAR